ncbi:WD40 repeat-like protein [Lentinus brumalis]|uniref:WD40 repeat-like protein n=1 Tax=Lentinus brumalis TaxID=2498619 RepID=A0A371CYD2_9APHY|nr:WD40 repeat-like protein [Polyporus brumalis]
MSGDKGAVLVTKEPSVSTSLPLDRRIEFIGQLVRMRKRSQPPPETLRLINGITTTPGPWVIVTLPDPVKTLVAASCDFSNDGSAGITIPVGNTWTLPNAAALDGAGGHAEGDNFSRAQYLFVDRLVLQTRRGLLSKHVSAKYDPLNDLLDYILEEQPNAYCAVATDGDVISMLEGESGTTDVIACLKKLSPETFLMEVHGMKVGVLRAKQEKRDAPQATDQPDYTESHQHQQNQPDISEPAVQGTAETTLSDPISIEPPAEDSEAGAPGICPPQQPMEESTNQPQHESTNKQQKESTTQLQKQPIIWEPAADGHTGTVTSLAVSPDSKWVASGSEDTTIILWDTEDQSVVRKWEASVETVRDLTFSPDSKRLAASGNEGRVVIWDVEQGNELGTLEGHRETVHTVVWSPDGTKLATGSDDMTVRIWDAETYQQIRSLEGHNAMVTFVMFSPDGKLLASGGADYNCRLWVVETGELKHELSGHKGMVWTAAFDPEVRRVATASDDGSVRIWSVETGEELVILHEHTGPVWVVAFTEDGKQIMSASSDSTVKICNSFSGERIMEIDGHDSMVNAAQFSPDGKYIATASSDNTVKLWNRADGTNLVTFNEHNDKVTHAVFSPDGLTLSSASDDGKIRIRLLSEFIKAEGEGEGTGEAEK